MYTPQSPGVPICFLVTKTIRYRARNIRHFHGEYAMMKELLRGGPIACNLASNPAFANNYTTGIYEDKTQHNDVDHIVEVVGWGEENGQKYWHVRNSWGT